MSSKRRRRAWEDAGEDREGDGDSDADPFGFDAAAAEERAIAARRARLRTEKKVVAVRPKTAVPRAAEKGDKVPESRQSASTGVAPDTAGNGVSEGPATQPQPHSGNGTARGNGGGLELRAALLQLRDAKKTEANGTTRESPVKVSQAKKRQRAKLAPHADVVEPDFDMFADTPEGGDAEGARPRAARPTVRGIDDAADADGYARLQLDEAMDDGKYIAGPALGQGMFSSVYRATCTEDGSAVAVKVLRNNDVMRRAGREEVHILQRIVDADPMDRRHCVRMVGHFEHRGHVVIVFEELAMNLRDVVKRFGGGGGIRLAAVRLYASQLLSALHLLGHLGIVHADIKPDNAIVSEDKAIVKLCDFGSAMDELSGETDPTPYLVSRFYRAPEVILGVLPYTRALDMWSVGCVLYELYTGRIAFPGSSNNDMLLLMQNRIGAIPSRMARRASFRGSHYDEAGRFIYNDTDTGSVRARVMPERGAQADAMGSDIMAASAEDDDRPSAHLLVDLLDAILVIDPAKRISASDALKMPFFSVAKS